VHNLEMRYEINGCCQDLCFDDSVTVSTSLTGAARVVGVGPV